MRAALKDITIEVFKARQDFYQHLMLLNAGTLSLLLTVVLALAATDHLSAVHVHDARPFMRGCGMLVGSILLSLVHNHLNLALLIHTLNSHIGYSGSADLQSVYAELRRAGIEADAPDGSADLEAKGIRHGKLGGIVENVNRVLGPAAQLLTWVAYFEFFLSIRAIILSVAK